MLSVSNNTNNQTQPVGLNQYVKPMSQDCIAVLKNPNYAEEQEEKKSNKKAIWTIFTVAGTVTVAALTLILLQRGKLGTKAQEFKKFVETKLVELTKKESVTNLEKFYIKNLNRIKNLLDRTKVINNAAAVKDIPVNNFLHRIGLGGFCTRITRGFEKLTNKTVRKSYGKTGKSIDKVFEKLASMNAATLAAKNPNDIIRIGNTSKTVAEWLKLSADYQQATKTAFQNSFGETAQKGRYENLKEAFKDIREKFYDRVFKNKDYKQLTDTFVLEDIASKTKIEYATKIQELKSVLTNGLAERCENTYKFLSDIKINPNELESYKMLNNLKAAVKSLGKTVEGSTQQQKILSQISEMKSTLITRLSKSPGNEQSKEIVKLLDDAFKGLENPAQTGNLQELLKIQKGLLTPKEYAEFEKTVAKAIKSINKSAKLESGDYVDKIRDFSSGSVVTDVLFSGLAPVLGTTAALVTADSKQQRRSSFFKMGIPLLGGVAVVLACTAGIVPIGISMIYGFGSSLALNYIGKKINDKINERELIADLNKKNETPESESKET